MGDEEFWASVVIASVLCIPLFACLTGHWIGYVVTIMWGWLVISIQTYGLVKK